MSRYQAKIMSSRARNKLSARQVATLTEPNVYSDGGGLYLRVRVSGRSWFYIGTLDGKRIELGLGSALDVTLAKARERAAAIRTLLIDGIDPRVERATAKIKAKPAVTFGTFAMDLVDDIEDGFKNPKHRQGAVSLIATRLRLAHEGRKWPISGGERLPLGQSDRAAQLVYLAIDEVTFRVEMVVKRGVDGNEFL